MNQHLRIPDAETRKRVVHSLSLDKLIAMADVNLRRQRERRLEASKKAAE